MYRKFLWTLLVASFLLSSISQGHTEDDDTWEPEVTWDNILGGVKMCNPVGMALRLLGYELQCSVPPGAIEIDAQWTYFGNVIAGSASMAPAALALFTTMCQVAGPPTDDDYQTRTPNPALARYNAVAGFVLFNKLLSDLTLISSHCHLRRGNYCCRSVKNVASSLVFFTVGLASLLYTVETEPIDGCIPHTVASDALNAAFMVLGVVPLLRVCVGGSFRRCLCGDEVAPVERLPVLGRQPRGIESLDKV